MINIYDSQGLFIGRTESVRGACTLSRENIRTISKRLNNPARINPYNYYTDDERGHLVRLAYETLELAKSIAYPTQAQIEICSKAVMELLK